MGKFTQRYVRVFSRHPSHDIIRKTHRGVLAREKAVIRFGSETESKIPIQINSIEAVRNSANKRLSKECFDKAGVNTPAWDVFENFLDITEEGITFQNSELAFPVVIKNVYGSRNTGNYLIKTKKEFLAWMNTGKDFGNYIVEKYSTFSREYRLHVTADGCFYTCRKLLKQDAPQEHRWYRNDKYCNWIVEENDLFNKPSTWDTIVADCVSAIKSVGLDVGACDVKVNKKGKHTILEVCSAPSFGERTAIHYAEIIPGLVNKKIQELKLQKGG